MSSRVCDPEGLFSIEVPEGWQFFPDEHGGGLIPPDKSAVVHLYGEAVEDPADLPNLSRMLAGFITLRGKAVAPDDLFRLQIKEYPAFAWRSQEKGKKAVRMWVVGNEFAWVFINFQADLDAESRWRLDVDRIVASLDLMEAEK